MEEERRLCYVGMTRAEKRLILSWARYRRRFGGGEPERSIASRFLQRGPGEPDRNLGGDDHACRTSICTPSATRSARRVKRNLYTGKTYNSVENISQFFAERGVAFPARPRPAAAGRSPPPAAACRQRRRRPRNPRGPA